MKLKRLLPVFFISAVILFAASTPLLGKAPEGEMFGVFSNAYETPHIAWAKPYINGKLKALVIAPLSTQRESVELWQRLDCEVFPVMTAGVDKPIDVIGSYCGDISADEVRALGEETIEKAGDWDVAIVARTRWDKLPGDWRLAILIGVRQRGAGLILIQQNPEGELKNILKEDAPVSAGNYFENIIPWNDLPAFCHRNAGQPNLRLAQYGQGRIAAINYLQKPISANASSRHCLTPGAYAADAYYGEDVYRWHSPDYDYYMSLVVRTILWAARKEAVPNFSFFTLPQVRIEREKLGKDATLFVPWPGNAPKQHWWLREKAAIRFGIAGDYNPPVELEWLIRNRWNEIEKEGIIKKIELTPGIGGEIELPAFPAGRHYLEARLKKDGKICDWAIIPFSVETEYPKPVIRMDKESFKRGETVSGKVLLAGTLLPGTELNVELWDNCDRLLAKRKLTGQPAEQFQFSDIDPLTQNYIAKAALIDKDGEIISDRVEFLIPRRGNDEFQFVPWYQPVSEPISGYYLNRLKELGVDSIMPGHLWVTPQELIEHCQVITRANLRVFTYLSSMCGFGMSKIYNQQGEPVCSTNGCLLHEIPWQATESAGQFREKAELYEPFALQGIMLSEEDGFDFGATDRCFCPKCKESFRKYLEASYKTIQALNASWGTNYKNWSECNPIVYEEAKKTGQLPRWVDHRMHMMKLWTEFHLELPKPFEKYAPEIECVFMWNSYRLDYVIDLYRLYSKYGPTFGLSDYVPKGLCNAPGYGTYPTSIGSLAKKRLEPWAFLSQGANGVQWWTIGDNSPGGSYGDTIAPLLSASFESVVPYFAVTLESVREIKRGPGKLIIGAKKADIGIRVLESPAAMMVSHFSHQETTWEASQKEFTEALDHAGLPYTMLAPQQVLDGKLEYPKVKVLVLPFSQALSKQESENILAFAKKGGTVIADFAPGIMDEHGKKLAASGLAALFPEMKPMAITGHGSGKGVYLGNLIRGKTFSEGLDYSWMDEFLKVFKAAGIEPVAGIFGENKTRDYTLVPRMFEDGENRYLFIIRGNAGGSVAFDATGAAKADGKAAENKLNAGTYQVVFPGNYHIYDLRQGKYLNYGKEASLALGPEDMKLLSLLPYKADKMTIKTTLGKERKVSLQAVLEGSQNSLGRHVFRMTLIGPDGKEMPFWGRNVEAPGGKFNGTFPFALNDPPGKYTVTVADTATGIAGKSEVDVK